MGTFIIILLLAVAIAAIVSAVNQSNLRAAVENRSAIERDIIRAAMMCGGHITALDVKSHHAHTVGEIEECLRLLHTQGYCTSELTSEGRHVYTFGAFDDSSQRALALEKEILRIAEIHAGVVRVHNVALATDLSYLEARQALEEMCRNKICAGTGEPDVYQFYSMGYTALPNAPETMYAQPAPAEAEPPASPDAGDAGRGRQERPRERAR